MSFAYPFVLLLLAVPILMLVWEWRRRGQRVVMPFDHGKQRRGRFLGFMVNCAQSLTPLILAVVIVIMAGPQKLSSPKNKKVITNIQFCLDVSGSMNAAFGEGNRYDAAMSAINQFIDYRDGDSFGLTIFGASFLHWVPITEDTSAFKCAPPFLAPSKLPPWFNGGTRIGMALEECEDLLTRTDEGDRMIILISDGYSSDLYGDNAQRIGRKLEEANIAVYAIHAADGAPPDQLYSITDITGGEVFAAGDPQGLEVVFKRIDEMQETKMEKVSAEKLDNFQPFVFAGLALVGLKMLTLFGLRYTPW